MTDYTELKRLATRIVEVQTSQDVPISKLFDDFDAATSPEVILALIADLDEARNGMKHACAIRLKKQIEKLKAENERLRSDDVRFIALLAQGEQS